MPGWQRVAVSVFEFIAGRLRTIEGALMLAIGAVLLINAWQSGPARWRERAALRSLTGRGVATVERVWWRLDRALDAETLRASAMDYIARALLSGTTALIDHHESPNFIEGSLAVLAEACERSNACAPGSVAATLAAASALGATAGHVLHYTTSSDVLREKSGRKEEEAAVGYVGVVF